ncbi:MAG TPA: P-II family nitrogen regulator [Candidatus Aphodoplasma excrementigallinarum]|uniref:P-II family nitrogen regulator n=1 Tax=Candidatus Aphodoplasma excrementigallinarum TaxID=2840673 RepID=A0A9D1NGW1_9FIRM|nr:P-II family nitrogen regulator [Candidatus Aphodoplasma excrementigallinarum]
MMYKVEAIIREEKLEDIKAALHEIEINGVTAYQVMGFGAQHGYTTVVRGQEVDAMLLPKIKLEIVVSSEEWKEKTIRKIREVAYTGEMGDGKIFAYEITDAVKIRTGESGYDALQSSGEDIGKK